MGTKSVHKTILKKQAELCIMPTFRGLCGPDLLQLFGTLEEDLINLLFDNQEKTEEGELYEQACLEIIQAWPDKSEQERVGWVQQESLKFDVPELVERVPTLNKRKSLRRPGVFLTNL